jgi:hypothetical protein
MREPNSRSGPSGRGRSEAKTGQVGTPKDSSTVRQHPAADAWRAHAPADLSASLGVRPDGPLDWTPDDLPAPWEGHAVEGPAEVARRRTLTRRRLDDLRLLWHLGARIARDREAAV